MNRIIFFSLALCFIFSSCGNKTVATSDEQMDFSETLSSTDTIRMLNLSDSCMFLLKDKNIDGALSMLYEYDDSSSHVSPLSEETQSRYKRLFTLFPVFSFQRVKYVFKSEGLNDVKYEVIFAEGDNNEANGVPKTTFMFNPVKVDGRWYLTVKRSDQSISL